MNPFLPISARVRAMLFGTGRIPDSAVETIELAPKAIRTQPAAISLPGENKRILAFQEETTPDSEFERMRPGERSHGATIAYRLENAVFAQGSLYFNGGHTVLRPKSAQPLLPRHADHFMEAQVCTHSVIERYFGHWLSEGTALELLASQRRMPGLKFFGKPWLHEPGYRELLGLKAILTNHAQVERLWVVDDRGLNDGWLARFEELRRRIRSAATLHGPKRVMLTRGRLGAKRELINSNKVQATLENLGFEFIDPETETVQHIVEKLAHAEIAITVEGSQQKHCLLAMPAGSTLLIIQPATRFNAFSKAFTDAVRMRWAFVVADAKQNGFQLQIDRLMRTIDEVIRIAGPER